VLPLPSAPPLSGADAAADAAGVDPVSAAAAAALAARGAALDADLAIMRHAQQQQHHQQHQHYAAAAAAAAAAAHKGSGGMAMPVPSLLANPAALWRSMQLQLHHGPGAKDGVGMGAFKRPREEAAEDARAAVEVLA
jgi:hypothetical protein